MKKFKYKIGDKVRIKKFKKIPHHWNTEMKNWICQHITIKDVRLYNYYIYENDWCYFEHDFETYDSLSKELFGI